MGYASTCIDKGGTLAWDPPCCEGAQVPDCSYSNMHCIPNSYLFAACYGDHYECTCSYTPLVLSFDRAPVEFIPAAASFAFDLTGAGQNIATDWPTARTPWLALDRDGDGRIN